MKARAIAAAASAAYARAMTTVDQMATRLNDRQGWVAGKRIKLDFGADGLVLLDGIGKQVTREDGPADTTITVAWDDLMALGRGELDPVSALMKGKLRIDGDMSNAMQLQSVIEKLQSD